MESYNYCGIFYHFPCYDGGYGALNTYLYFKYFSKEKYIFKFHGLQTPNDKFEDIDPDDYKIIIILDLELLDDDIDFIEENSEINFLIFDHHISWKDRYLNEYKIRIDKCENIKIIYDMDNISSACLLSYNYFKNESLTITNNDIEKVENFYSENLLLMCEYISDSDTGTYKLQNHSNFKAALCNYIKYPQKIFQFKSKNTVDDKMNDLLEIDANKLINEKENEKTNYIKRAIKELLKNKINLVKFPKGEQFFICYTQIKSLRNAIGPILGKISKKYNFLPIGGIVYPFQGKYKFSMRTFQNGDYDVSEIAKRYNGGGHKDAASFTMSFKLFDSLIVNDVIVNIKKDIEDIDINEFVDIV